MSDLYGLDTRRANVFGVVGIPIALKSRASDFLALASTSSEGTPLVARTR